MPIQVKRDPYLWAFAAVLVMSTLGLVWQHAITFKEGSAFIIGALAMPALFGSKKDDGDDGQGGGGPAEPDPKKDTIPVPRPPTVVPFTSLLILAGCAACGGDLISPADEAAAGYDAQQKACIAKYKTRAQMDACRDDVKARWTVTDAGAADAAPEAGR